MNAQPISDPLFQSSRLILSAGTLTNCGAGQCGGAPSVNLRDGATNPALSGPLGATLIQRLTDPVTGIVLDTWIDADGQAQGDTVNITGPP